MKCLHVESGHHKPPEKSVELCLRDEHHPSSDIPSRVPMVIENLEK